MRRHFGLLLLLTGFAAVALLSCSHGTSDSKVVPASSDSIYTEKNIMRTYGSNPQRALVMIDSALLVGNVTEDKANLMRATVYSASTDAARQDTAIIICEWLLKRPEAQEDLLFRSNVLEALVYSARVLEDFELVLQYGTERSDVCRQLGLETAALRSEADIGIAQIHMGLVDEGLSRIDNTIRRTAHIRQFSEMDATVLASKRKIRALIDLSRYAEVIPEGQRILDHLADLEQHHADYRDNDPRLSFDEAHRHGYIDFYRTQTYSFMASAYAHLGEKQKARHYLSLFEQCDYAQSIRQRQQIASTLCLLGDYAQMETIYKEVEVRFYLENDDTLNSDYAALLRDRAIAAQAQGRKDASIALWRRYAEVNRQKSERLLAGKANLYAARYHAQEQQAELARKDAELARHMTIMRSLVFLVIVALVAAVWFFHQKRMTSRKNRILAAQIAEAVAAKEKNRELELELRPDELPSDVELGQLDDAQLFEVLGKKIENERLYLDPSFDRQSLMDLTGLSKERIGAAFARGGNQASLSSYVNRLRLEHASQLLTGCPTLGIEQVALQSGFSSRKYFSEKFKTFFGMLPTEFRQARM